MAAAVAAFALPLTVPAGAVVAAARVAAAGALADRDRDCGALAIGGVLFAWRTWYYTGVFSVFHGTQREFLAVWKPGMAWPDAVRAMAQQPDDGADRPGSAAFCVARAAASRRPR